MASKLVADVRKGLSRAYPPTSSLIKSHFWRQMEATPAIAVKKKGTGSKKKKKKNKTAVATESSTAEQVKVDVLVEQVPEVGDTSTAAKSKKKTKGEKKASGRETKKKLAMVNNKIKEFASKKELGKALKEFKRLGKSDVKPSIHTYTSLINACVRCYELERAMHYFNSLQAAGLEPNEITYTVIIKGLMQEGKMANVRRLLMNMKVGKIILFLN